MGLIFILHRHKIMKKIHLLVNLKSGSNRGEKALEQIKTILKNEKMKMTSKIKFYMIEKQMWFFVKILSKLRKFYFKYLKRNYN